MTKEGRLQRGKENVEHKNLDGTIGRFQDNSETLEYLDSIKDKKATKPKEAEDAKPTK